MTVDFDLPHGDELSDFDNRFRIILRTHLIVLGWWSILNFVGGLTALFILRGGAYYFSMMSGIWGIVNFAVAVAVFYHAFYQKRPKHSAYERLVVQNHVEWVLFFNIGLDAAFVFVGFLLREHSFICDVSYPDLWLGFGWAIIMQGLFLLVQDTTILHLHRRNFRKAQPFFEKLLVEK